MKPLYGIPGLDSNRLAELYAGVRDVTGDQHSRVDLTFAKEGHIRLAAHWTEANGTTRDYVTELSAADIADAKGAEDDAVFLDWADAALGAITLLRRQRAAIASSDLTIGQRIKNAAGNFAAMLGHRRMNRMLDKAEQERDT